MDEAFVDAGGARLFSRADGPADGPAVVFSNSLGTDLSLWDPLLPHLPEGLRIVRYDNRGHGRSDVPPAPYAMGALVSDAEAVCDHWGVSPCVFVGLSVGGMIAQGLAVKRPDLMRAVVLSNTGAKIGTATLWADRIATVEAKGVEALADGILQPNGTRMSEPRMDVNDVAETLSYMAKLSLDSNAMFVTVMATKMPFAGRG